jgi:uncharacterized ion transporter superfamily protein YfcC
MSGPADADAQNADTPDPAGSDAGTPNADSPDAPQQGGKRKHKLTFPSSLTILAGVTIVVWALTFVIPTGTYEQKPDGTPIQGTYHRTPNPLTFHERLNNLFLAPVNGLYGIKDAKTGQVGPDAAGALYGSAGVFLFVLAIGAFITVVFATGAMDRGIGRLAYRLRSRGALLIAGIMVVFSLLGSVEGFAEETLGFYGLIVPLMLALGYDRLVATAAIILGAGVGVLCSTVNPFAIGVASSAAGISLGDGIILRSIMWVVLTLVTVGYVVRYGLRVQKSPDRSMVGFLPGDREQAASSAGREPEALTGVHKAVLIALGLTFALMIFGVIPWASVITGKSDATPYRWELDWSFAQLAALFIVAAIVMGAISRMGEAKFSSTFIQGAGDFISPALVIVLARGITVIMNNSQVTDTVLHSMEGLISGTSAAVFGILVYVVNLPLAFLIPSTSGHATLVMPILAPLAQFANVPKSLVVTAWAAATGWMNLWEPTAAVVMGGVALAKVRYDRYLRFIAPLLGILFVLICAFVAIGAAMN